MRQTAKERPRRDENGDGLNDEKRGKSAAEVVDERRKAGTGSSRKGPELGDDERMRTG